jgi:hypothetical protein
VNRLRIVLKCRILPQAGFDCASMMKFDGVAELKNATQELVVGRLRDDKLTFNRR